MRCPSCGFNNLNPQDRCVRCKKPFDAKARANFLDLDQSGSFDLAGALEQTGEFSLSGQAPVVEGESELGEGSRSFVDTEAAREDREFIKALELGGESAAEPVSGMAEDEASGGLGLGDLAEASVGSGSGSAAFAEALMAEYDEALAGAPADEITEDLTGERSSDGLQAELLAAAFEPDPMEEEVLRDLELSPLALESEEAFEEAAEEPMPEGPMPEESPSPVLSSQAVEPDLFDAFSGDAPPSAEVVEAAAAVLETMAANDPAPPEELSEGPFSTEESQPSMSDSVAARARMIEDFFGKTGDESSVVERGAEADEQSEIAIERPSDQSQSHSRPLAYELPFAEDSNSISKWAGGIRIKGSRQAMKSRFRLTRLPGLPRFPRLAWTPDLRRTAAGLFDYAVWCWLGVVLYEAGRLLTGAGAFAGTTGAWLIAVAFPLAITGIIIALVYGSLFGGILGQTPGMMIFKLRMKGRTGDRPGLAGALVWSALQTAATLPLGLGLFILRGKEAGSWRHDRWTGIVVEWV